MRIKIIYQNKKPPITERMKKYATFDYEKVKFDGLRKIENGRYIDPAYLYDFIGDYDGLMAVIEGDELDGVYGNNRVYRGKNIMQVEWRKGYRKWKQNKLTRLWSLVFNKKKGDYEQILYTIEHELGHALCDFYHIYDTLHAWVKLKKYEDWWKHINFPELEPVDNIDIEWWHNNYGGKIEPKCYILHTDLGHENSTRDEILHSGRSISYNYYVTKEGNVIEFVPEGYEAWHTGVAKDPTPEVVSFFSKLKNQNLESSIYNSNSIGICFEGMGEDANKLQEQAIRELIKENPMPIFAHKEITSYKPQAPLNLKRKLTEDPVVKEEIPSEVIIKVIQALQKLKIIK